MAKKGQQPRVVRSKPSNADAVIARLTDELTAAQARLKMETDIAIVRMKRIEQLQKELETTITVSEGLKKKLDCYQATRSFWPLHLRDAITNGDVETVKVETARSESVQKEWHEQFRSLEGKLVELKERLEAERTQARVTGINTGVAVAKESSAERIEELEAFIRKTLRDGQINCTEATELLEKKS